MPVQLLTTKLHIPYLRSTVVQRSRLVTWLEHGRDRKLTLISAPAGFGKTTALSEWITHCGCPVGWVSLDEQDRDWVSFLTYFVAALQSIEPHIGESVLEVLQVSPAPSPHAVLTALVNEIDRIPQRFMLILDDYHTLDSPSIDEMLLFLLDHLPSHMHLVIATREDPLLPLARLRAQNRLTELRAADLRFTLEETDDFLNRRLGLQLDSDDIWALQTRTEGWITGLQLAGLALQGNVSTQRVDASDFIRAFTGSHRFVLDYLVEEVFQRQEEHIRQFLLFTAILDRLNGALCDAVLGDITASGQDILETFEHANLLIVPLDENRHWYRYHHLFGEVLRARLLKAYPEQVAILHQRASAWYERNGFLSDAIHHAFAAGDVARAGALIERIWPSIRRTRQEAIFLPWVKALPDSLIRQRPVLSVVCAWALMDAGELDASEARLRDAEYLLDTMPEDMVIVDEEQFRSLPASIANARAYRAQALNDIPSTVMYTQLALDLLPQDAAYERGTTIALLGLAYWTDGKLEQAYQSFAQGLDYLQRGGGLLIRMGGTIILAHIREAQGHLYQAVKLYEQSLQLSAMHESPLNATAEMYLGMSELYLQQGNLPKAVAEFTTGLKLRERASLPGYEYLWCMVEASLKRAEGDFDAALSLLNTAERLYYRSPIPNIRPIAAMRARIFIAANRLPEALAWVRERHLSVDDYLSYLHEYESLTLVRVLLAQHRHTGESAHLNDAVKLLARLLQAAEASDRMRSILEISMLQALAFLAQGDSPAALKALILALNLAEGEGYVQLFVDEGAAMLTLMEKAVALEVHRYATLVLNAWGGEDVPMIPTLSRLANTQFLLIEPLSEREIEVLRLLKTELSGPEIADMLGVALSTVRTHTKSIYSKLNVGSRRAAVNRAEQLNLI